jgi:hypothetical protein
VPVKTNSPLPTPEETLSPSPKPSPSPKASPKASPSPSKAPKPSPSPKPSKEPENKDKKFRGASPDGPPELDRVYGDIFEGKSGRAYINIISNPKSWDGVHAYLIDLDTQSFRVLKFKKLKNKNVYKLEVPPGRYQLKLVKSGYFTFKAELPLQDRQEAEIAEPLEKRPNFVVQSSPPGAKVYFNDELAGITPTTVKNLEEKEYKIKIVKENYKTVSFPMSFKRGKDINKKIELSPGK